MKGGFFFWAFLIIHGILEPLSAILPSLVGFVRPQIMAVLFVGDLENEMTAYAFRTFFALNIYIGLMSIWLITVPLLQRGGFECNKDYDTACFHLRLLFVADLLYDLASFLTLGETPDASSLILLPAAIDVFVVLLPKIPFAFLGVGKNHLILASERAPLLNGK